MKLPVATQAQAGFTLIEVILALGLTAMLMTLLSSGMYFVARDWNRDSSVLDAELDEALIILQLDRALQGAFPHSYTNHETLSREIYFDGEDNYLGFVSTVSPQRTAGMTAWELSAGEGGVYLSLAQAFTDNPAQRLAAQEPRLILPGYELELAYLFEESADTRAWRDEWSGEELLSLPLAVYVRLTPADGPEQMLELVAPVRSNRHRGISPNTGALQSL